MKQTKSASVNLKWIRNAVMAAEMTVLLILWSFIPVLIRNTPAVHVGSGKYGLRAGALLLVLLPLFGLIPQKRNSWEDNEIHTDNAAERIQIEQEREAESFKSQLLISALGFIGAFFIRYCLKFLKHLLPTLHNSCRGLR